jgi:putative ABC transport system ATP-binding protein
MTAAVELQRVSKVYRNGHIEVAALRAVDLAVSRGELVAVMGPSGSGKSTLLTIAGTLEVPTSGRVLLGGQELAGLSANDRARLRRQTIGYVFQEYNLLPGLTAAENVALPLELQGLAPKRAGRLAAEAMDMLGLTDKVAELPENLSGGEAQRVALARAIVGDRHVILADEPTGALDSFNGERVMRTLRSACQGGAAGVVVTHDAQVAGWADRVVFLRDGAVVDQTVRLPGPEILLTHS